MSSDHVSAERLIEEVRIRPGLYDKDTPEYTDRISVTRLWQEVCESVILNWAELDESRKALKVTEIQQRWRNLRSCFKRSVNIVRFCPDKAKKYIYFNQMKFLLRVMPEKTDAEPTKNQAKRMNLKRDFNTTPKPGPSLVSPLRTPTTINPQDQSIINPSSDEFNKKPQPNFKLDTDDIDEDKLFMLSLVPSLRKMNDDQKIQVKMEFLSIIRQVLRENNELDQNSTMDRNDYIGDTTAMDCLEEIGYVQPDYLKMSPASSTHDPQDTSYATMEDSEGKILE